MKHVLLRGSRWLVRDNTMLGSRVALRLEDPTTGEVIEALCPPDEFEPLAEPAPTLDRRSLTPYGYWHTLHEALRLQTPPQGQYSAFVAGGFLLNLTSSRRSLDFLAAHVGGFSLPMMSDWARPLRRKFGSATNFGDRAARKQFMYDVLRFLPSVWIFRFHLLDLKFSLRSVRGLIR